MLVIHAVHMYERERGIHYEKFKCMGIIDMYVRSFLMGDNNNEENK